MQQAWKKEALTDVVNLVLGVWLFLSPWIFGFDPETAASWNAWLSGIVIAVLIVILIIVPFVIDANTFRPTLESELTDALARQVKVGNLSLSLLSGSVSDSSLTSSIEPAIAICPLHTAFAPLAVRPVSVQRR